MSVEAITWALSCRVERSSTKFVLVALANCANADMTCWPSVGYLCDATSQDRKTVMENLRRLVAGGYIEPTEGRMGATKQVMVYRLNSAKNGTVKEYQKRDSPENGTVPKTDGKSTVFPAKEYRFSAERVPKTGHGTVKEPSIEPSGNKKTTAAPDVSPVVWADWVTLRKAKKAAVTETALNGIRREAEKAGMDLEAALAMCCERGWVGFRADWVKDETQSQRTQGTRPPTAAEQRVMQATPSLVAPHLRPVKAAQPLETLDVAAIRLG